MREIVEPMSQPPGFRARRQFVRKVRGLEVLGSMCSRTSKRVTTSYWGGVTVVVVVVDADSGVAWVWVEARTSSKVVFKYWNRPLLKCASTVGSMRACSRAILIRFVDGSMAVMDAARVGVGAVALAVASRGIVRASDSAKMPPPQPTSR